MNKNTAIQTMIDHQLVDGPGAAEMSSVQDRGGVAWIKTSLALGSVGAMAFVFAFISSVNDPFDKVWPFVGLVGVLLLGTCVAGFAVANAKRAKKSAVIFAFLADDDWDAPQPSPLAGAAFQDFRPLNRAEISQCARLARRSSSAVVRRTWSSWLKLTKASDTIRLRVRDRAVLMAAVHETNPACALEGAQTTEDIVLSSGLTCTVLPVDGQEDQGTQTPPLEKAIKS